MLPKKLRSCPFLIFGHRGSPRRAPENTALSFRRALSEGAQGIEFDVRLSRDGEVFVFHDERLNRLTGHKGLFIDHDSQNLLPIKVLRKAHQSEFTFIPLLEEVLSEFRKDFFLYVELKIESSSEQFRHVLAQKTMALLEKYQLIEKSILVSFDYAVVKWAKQKDKRFYTGLNFSKWTELMKPRKDQFQFLDCLCPSFSLLSPELMKEAKENHLDVLPWVVNDAKSLHKAIHLGARGVATDDPSKILKIYLYSKEKT